MSGIDVNSIVLLFLGAVAGIGSLGTQILFWQHSDADTKNNKGFFSKIFSAIGDVFKRIWHAVSSWSYGYNRDDYNQQSFVRMIATMTILLCFFLLVLATFDQVSSFWVYFTLYVLLIFVVAPAGFAVTRKLWEMIMPPTKENLGEENSRSPRYSIPTPAYGYGTIQAKDYRYDETLKTLNNTN
jgi:hypothetical protein